MRCARVYVVQYSTVRPHPASWPLSPSLGTGEGQGGASSLYNMQCFFRHFFFPLPSTRATWGWWRLQSIRGGTSLKHLDSPTSFRSDSIQNGLEACAPSPSMRMIVRVGAEEVYSSTVVMWLTSDRDATSTSKLSYHIILY